MNSKGHGTATLPFAREERDRGARRGAEGRVKSRRQEIRARVQPRPPDAWTHGHAGFCSGFCWGSMGRSAFPPAKWK